MGMDPTPIPSKNKKKWAPQPHAKKKLNTAQMTPDVAWKLPLAGQSHSSPPEPTLSHRRVGIQIRGDRPAASSCPRRGGEWRSLGAASPLRTAGGARGEGDGGRGELCTLTCFVGLCSGTASGVDGGFVRKICEGPGGKNPAASREGIRDKERQTNSSERSEQTWQCGQTTPQASKGRPPPPEGIREASGIREISRERSGRSIRLFSCEDSSHYFLQKLLIQKK